MAEATRSTRVSDLDRWAEEAPGTDAGTEPAQALTPEIVEDADVELISRSFEAAAPPDAPAPPPPPAGAPDRPRLGEPASTGEPEAAAAAEQTTETDGADEQPPDTPEPERPEAPEWLEATEEPPIAIYSRDRLDTEPVDVNDYYPAARSDATTSAQEEDPDREEAAPDDAEHAAASATGLPAVWAGRAPAAVDTRSAGEAPVPTLFRDPARPAAATRLGLIVVALLSGWIALALFLLNNRIADVAAGSGSVSGMAAAQTLVNGRLRPALIGAAAITAIGLMRWTYRAYANLPSFGKSDLRAPRSAAVWAWLVPGVNLVLPPLLINDVWRGADVYARDDVRWKRRKGNPWVGVFVLGIVIAVGSAAISLLLVDRTSFQGAIDANRWLIFAAAGVVVACSGLARAIDVVTARQRQRMAALGGLL